MDQDVYLCSRCKQQPQGYFEAKMPAVADATQTQLRMQRRNSPEIIAYHKWLIYSAAFKEPLAEPQGARHVQFNLDRTKTFACKEDIFCRRQFAEAVEIWYARFPVCRKRSRSLLAARPRASAGGAPLDDPEDKEQTVGLVEPVLAPLQGA